jgi:hypothetical protein
LIWYIFITFDYGSNNIKALALVSIKIATVVGQVSRDGAYTNKTPYWAPLLKGF